MAITIQECELSYDHNRIEKFLRHTLEEKGWDCVDIAYHHNLPEVDGDKLKASDTSASLYYRTMPDMIASKTDKSMFVELKCSNGNRMYLEALPLAMNQSREVNNGVPCLYAYDGPLSGFNLVATWSREIVPERLIIPRRNKFIKELLLDHYVCPVEEKEPYRRGVSGDAYVVIPGSDVKQWKPIEEFL